jgi:hypothetical protein
MADIRAVFGGPIRFESINLQHSTLREVLPTTYTDNSCLPMLSETALHRLSTTGAVLCMRQVRLCRIEAEFAGGLMAKASAYACLSSACPQPSLAPSVLLYKASQSLVHRGPNGIKDKNEVCLERRRLEDVRLLLFLGPTYHLGGSGR